jgi:hypothetical protein
VRGAARATAGKHQPNARACDVRLRSGLLGARLVPGKRQVRGRAAYERDKNAADCDSGPNRP